MIGPPITANSANITTNDHLISDFFIESPQLYSSKSPWEKCPAFRQGIRSRIYAAEVYNTQQRCIL